VRDLRSYVSNIAHARGRHPPNTGAYDAAPVTTLLAYPNVSEGRDRAAIDRIGAAFGDALLDVHSDVDHHRSAYTLAGAPGELARAVTRGAEEAMNTIRIDAHAGVHPRVGAIDVAPIIYLSDQDRGAACAEALVLADLLGCELQIPVFLYGILANGRTRAQLRKGGPAELQRRIDAGELRPDFGPPRLHPTAGAVLVAARPPLVAFNVELAPPATLDQAREIAALIREGGEEGLPKLRAIGLWLAAANLAQVSTNVEDHRATPLRAVLDAVARHAPVQGAELVGLAPEAAFDGFPPDIPLRGYATIEEILHRHAHTA
jgi:glutamate formiminotransferase / 5-formyltetrahydrofolate cyclo-ligase